MKRMFIVLIVLLSIGFCGSTKAQEGVVRPPVAPQNPPVVLPNSPLTNGVLPPPAQKMQPAPPRGIPVVPPNADIEKPVPPQDRNAGLKNAPLVRIDSLSGLLGYMPKAVNTANKLNRLIKPGKIWVERAVGGEVEIKGAILYKNVVVAVVRFGLKDSEPLPVGVIYHTYKENIDTRKIQSRFLDLFDKLRILPYAEFIEPQRCWAFPIVLDNKIVSYAKIFYDGAYVVEDSVANRQMNANSR